VEFYVFSPANAMFSDGFSVIIVSNGLRTGNHIRSRCDFLGLNFRFAEKTQFRARQHALPEIILIVLHIQLQ